MRFINIIPSRPLAVFLALLPFALVFIAYAIGSEIRLSANPSDKLLPAPGTVWDTAVRLTTEGDRRTGRILFWHDTWASLQRLGIGILISATVGLFFGLVIGLLPLMRSFLAQFVAVLSMIPPLALLPILFIVFGLGELSKVVLIVVGTLPFLIRDLSQRTLEIPQELLVKAQTLGASSWVIAIRVALPQVMPRLIQAVRLSLGLRGRRQTPRNAYGQTQLLLSARAPTGISSKFASSSSRLIAEIFWSARCGRIPVRSNTS